MNFSVYIPAGHVTIFGWMLTTACCLVVGLWLELGLDLVPGCGWLVVIHTYLYYLPLSLYRGLYKHTRRSHMMVQRVCNCARRICNCSETNLKQCETNLQLRENLIGKQLLPQIVATLDDHRQQFPVGQVSVRRRLSYPTHLLLPRFLHCGCWWILRISLTTIIIIMILITQQ